MPVAADVSRLTPFAAGTCAPALGEGRRQLVVQMGRDYRRTPKTAPHSWLAFTVPPVTKPPSENC
jgi:hypothetical protein